ncbi:DNA-formamidopyrimidine glycosylase [Candidatus Saccharibacteria bacterium]|nr:DNA-formamidopyrimidine glycosylase [Candidatus Saccharibacteria bacterium]
MPELPEVETVRIGLSALIIGRQVSDVSHDTDKSFPNTSADADRFLVGARVLGVRRRAKVLLIDLDSMYSLVIHLKMTGQLVFVSGGDLSSHTAAFRGRSADDELISASNGGAGPSLRFGAGHPNDSLIGTLPDKSTRVTLTFSDGSHLYFNDQRKFGWVRLMPTVEIPNIDFMQKLGPEPLGEEFTPAVLYERLRRRKGTTIKAALLDQSVLAGVGNIYADEALWGARIHPGTKVAQLSPEQVALLHRELQFVLRLSIEKGGSSDRNYVNAEGKKGSYISFARVFRREGQSCPRCGTTIEKIRVAGRGTHICPVCQQL